ncbi:DUF1963 domain-containing protein [Streptomyces sp. RKAG290]|uniref:DUF1963 domain-containing protein n=1 Tax=Streptomyces sp. RKAG290 TaxID=2888348 RepID=UPI00203386D1|nr:DUF1963 domain-containing protein [Streptomyces sp. RKAG290]MCM2413548.1 DUF1963 domain-containing protein [Streptomyces sp. RKAG290]
MTHVSRDDALCSLARQHLSPDAAEQWLGLLRPGVRLEPQSGEDAVVGRLGGVPGLPAGTDRLEWEGHGPHSFGAHGREPRLAEEVAGWVLLAQFAGDAAADMIWGGLGTLYWLIRPQDLRDRRFDRAMFTWQCS